jgi:hypothetical protein
MFSFLAGERPFTNEQRIAQYRHRLGLLFLDHYARGLIKEPDDDPPDWLDDIPEFLKRQAE